MKFLKSVLQSLTAFSLLTGIPVLAQTNDGIFTFEKSDLSLPVQRAGMFVGQSGGAFIAGGGLDEHGKPSAEVFVKSDSGWRKLTLDEPVAFAGFASGTLRRGWYNFALGRFRLKKIIPHESWCGRQFKLGGTPADAGRRPAAARRDLFLQ